MSFRQQRVAEQVQAELGRLFLHEVRDPRVQLVGISRLELSRDLKHARVHISVLEEGADPEEIQSGLDRAAPFLRSRLAANLNLRATPTLKFIVDHGAEHSQHMARLLKELVPDDE